MKHQRVFNRKPPLASPYATYMVKHNLKLYKFLQKNSNLFIDYFLDKIPPTVVVV